MKVLRYPQQFIETSLQLEGTIEEWNDYMGKMEPTVLATYQITGGDRQVKICKVNNERVSFFITPEEVEVKQ